MPWRLLALLLIGSIVLIFIGLNLEHTSSISFGFTVAEDVPVPISLGTAFLVGVAISLPLTGRRRPGSRSASAPQRPTKKADAASSGNQASDGGRNSTSASQESGKRSGIGALFRRRGSQSQQDSSDGSSGAKDQRGKDSSDS